MLLKPLFGLLLPLATIAAELLHTPRAAACSDPGTQACAPKLARMLHQRIYGFDTYPFGAALRLTIYTAAQQSSPSNPIEADKAQTLDSVGELFAALRSCWVAPADDKARHGMEMTVRFALKRNGEIIAPPRVTYASHGASPETRDIYFKAIMDALLRCRPLRLTDALASEISGVPIALRFVDDRQLQ